VKKRWAITVDIASNGIASVTVIVAQNAAPGQTQINIAIGRGGKLTV
jgi:hypothetical protein